MCIQSANFQDLFCRTKTQKKVSDHVPSVRAVSWLTIILPYVGTRQNVAINSNRWAGRTPSQHIHRNVWTPPDLPEQHSDPDRILRYSRQDYVIGESSQDQLRNIAHRLNHGPSPEQTMPELDTSELESEMAELSRQRSTATELDGNLFAVELDAGPDVWPRQLSNHFQGETLVASSRRSEETPNGHSSGTFNEAQDLQAETEHASPNAARQVRTAGRKWEGGFFEP